MSRRRVLEFSNSNQNSPLTKLDGVQPKMLPAACSKSSLLQGKVARLLALRPTAADVIERLVDDLLEDCG